MWIPLLIWSYVHSIFVALFYNQTCWHFFFFFSTKTYMGTHNICCQGEIRKIFYQILHNRLIAVNSSCNSKYGTFFQPKLLIVSYFSMKAYIVCYGYSLEMRRNKKNIFPIPFLIWSYAPLQLQFINYHSGLIQLMANWWYFSYFSKKINNNKTGLTFPANCLQWRQFAWNVKTCFLGKIRKIFWNVVCWNFYPEC